MKTLNLGILAHVDAGKTSLTERLLHSAGVIDEVGSVDAGTTQTDSMDLERRRGITIKSAVVSFVIGDVTVNLIDTPGHPDFIAEVERVLSVLDGAVLVVSAVEGVQAQTRVLMRTLRRLRIPTLICVNKIDRAGAQYDTLLRTMSERLASALVPMGSVDRLGTHDAAYTPYGAGDADHTARLVELLADHDDAFLAAYVDDDTTVSYPRLRAGLVAQTGRALAYPVFFGSAITGAGVDAIVAGITGLLPATRGDADGPVTGSVFKVERGSGGEKIAYVRVFSGRIGVREKVRYREEEEKVTGISVFDHGSTVQRPYVAAGEIGRLRGLSGIRIGDTIGAPRSAAPDGHHFNPPTLETVVLPVDVAGKVDLHRALTQLAEQDPLINLRVDEARQEISVSLYGEVQKEVIQATLADDFGIEVTFRQTTTICVERPVGTGEAAEIMGEDDNPFLATVGLRVEPAPIGTGVDVRLGVELGSMPYSFFRTVEDTVRKTLRQGIHGWEVIDCAVTMTHSGYAPRQSHSHGTFDKRMSSTGGDFRGLTPLVLMSALKQAGTRVCEPLHHFHLEGPADAFGPTLGALAQLGAVPQEPVVRGSSCVIEGEIPAARVHGLQQQLPGLTSGEGLLESAFERYQEVRGAIPVRPRSDHNPLNRAEYLTYVRR